MTVGSVRRFRMTRLRRVGDACTAPLVRLGLVPWTYLLTTRGRRTGLPRTTPVSLIEQDGRRWLVAPYGPVSWVHNARAAGRVTLERAGRRTEYEIREVPPAEAGPVLQRYFARYRVTRPYFRAAPHAPVEDFVAEADRHPVFELTPVPPAGR